MLEVLHVLLHDLAIEGRPQASIVKLILYCIHGDRQWTTVEQFAFNLRALQS